MTAPRGGNRSFEPHPNAVEMICYRAHLEGTLGECGDYHTRETARLHLGCPAFLEPEGYREWLAEAVERSQPKKPVLRDACRNGHAYTADNVYVDKHGGRSCRQCRRDSFARNYKRKEVAA